jgi:uncharacterized protein YndB with AHSA1/START domain
LTSDGQLPSGPTEWRIHLNSPSERVYDTLASAAGRASFWAESAREHDGAIDFLFPDGSQVRSRILAAERPHRFALTYFGDSEVTFALTADGSGGCDLHLSDTAGDVETMAGWVSVLLALKGAVDFGVDVRNHDETRTWNHGYADN